MRGAEIVFRSREPGDANDGSAAQEQPRTGGHHEDVRFGPDRDRRASLRMPFVRKAFCTSMLALVALRAPDAHAQDVADDGRAEVEFAHPTFLDKLSGAPYVWFDDQTGSVTSYRVA